MDGIATREMLGTGLRIGDRAPDFFARSTCGDIRLTDFAGKWVVMFSHPADFTPVCTTEFVELARSAKEFVKRDCHLIALSVDSLFSHYAWLRLIRDRFGVEVRFPILEDPTLVIGRAYGMVGAQDNDSAAVRNTYFIDPEGVIRAMTCYPASVGRSIPEMLRTLDALQTVDAEGAMTPANWQRGDALLSPPVASLDDVYAADGADSWFMRDAAPARKDRKK